MPLRLLHVSDLHFGRYSVAAQVEGVERLIATEQQDRNVRAPPFFFFFEALRFFFYCQLVSNVPSDYMDPPRWIALTKEVTAALARADVSGVIISHGTDTLEETAWWLDLTVNSEKPIVLIGAQRNASEKDFDGPRNLLNAVRICVDPASNGKGAMIVLNDQINAARDVTKTHTSSVETFKSGDFGFLGVVGL